MIVRRLALRPPLECFRQGDNDPEVNAMGVIGAGQKPQRRSALRSAAIGGIALAAASGAARDARALQIAQDIDFSTAASISNSDPAPSATHSLEASATALADRFDPALGTLERVRISISGALTSSADARFADDDTFLATVSGRTVLQGMRLSFFIPGIIALRFIPGREATCSASPVFGAPSCVATLDEAVAAFATFNATVPPSALSSYIGDDAPFFMSIFQGGSLFVEIDQTDVNDDGYVSTRSASLSLAGNIRIIYDYTAPPPPTAAPEPGSLALLAGGLALLIGRRRSLG